MAQLLLYKNFSKRKNSTKQPTTAAYTLDIKTKLPVSLQNPVFVLSTVDLAVNYCKFEGHYYYVDDIQLNLNGMYELHCSMDELASHKSEIVGTEQYIIRGTRIDGEYDEYIPDNQLSQKQSYIASKANIDILDRPTGTLSLLSGTFVLGVTGKSASDTDAGVEYFAINLSDLQLLTDYLFSNVITGTVISTIINPLQYVSSCVWYPINISHIADLTKTQRNIFVGPWDTGVSAYPVLSSYEKITDINTGHGAYQDFTDISANWTSVMMRIFTQTISIDPMHLSHPFRFDVSIDLRTGQGLVKILSKYDDKYPLITSVNAQIGVPVPLSQISTNIGGAFTSLVSTVASAVTENYAGAVAGAVSTVSAATGLTNTVNGTQGNFTLAVEAIQCTISVFHKEKCYRPYDFIGRPIMKKDSLNNYTYVQCMNPIVDIVSFGIDKDTINSYLSSGVYIE